MSTPERAVLELLDELSGGKTFHRVDMLMEDLVGLSSKRTSRLLRECRSVKVKRLFLWCAATHGELRARLLDATCDRLRDPEAAREAVGSCVAEANALFDLGHWTAYAARIERAARMTSLLRRPRHRSPHDFRRQT